MNNPSFARLLSLAALALLWPVPPLTGAEFDQTHALLTGLLDRQVKDGRVNYAALKEEPAALHTYLDQVAAVPELEFKRWSEADRLALLINLYNAATLKLIVDHYPVKSIKDIGGLLRSPWKQKVVRLFGQVITLDHLEHEIIRKEYPDARAHFALVCAARGCPPAGVRPCLPKPSSVPACPRRWMKPAGSSSASRRRTGWMAPTARCISRPSSNGSARILSETPAPC